MDGRCKYCNHLIAFSRFGIDCKKLCKDGELFEPIGMKDISDPEIVSKVEHFVEDIKSGAIKNRHVEKKMEKHITNTGQIVSEQKKFQMTVEQFDEIFKDCIPEMFYSIIKINAEEKGYIRKSELQILIDEIEEMHSNHFKYFSEGLIKDILEKYYETIQALKKNNPEVK